MVALFVADPLAVVPVRLSDCSPGMAALAVVAVVGADPLAVVPVRLSDCSPGMAALAVVAVVGADTVRVHWHTGGACVDCRILIVADCVARLVVDKTP